MRIHLAEDDEVLADALYRTPAHPACAVDLANGGAQADRALSTTPATWLWPISACPASAA